MGSLLAREFDVDTRFQKMASRPGGLSRRQALKNAEVNIEKIKPYFIDWLDAEIARLSHLIPDAAGIRRSDLSWLDALEGASIRMVDVAATMNHPLANLVAHHLHIICEAVRRGAPYYDDIVTCHLDALWLCRQACYCDVTPESVSKLGVDLRRVLLLKYPQFASEVIPVQAVLVI